jgi:hypothetical protein
MVYELRKWFDDGDCLYTDDRRVKDLAIQSPNLRVVGTYFRSVADRQPFAWDIVGDPQALAGIAGRFQSRARSR